MRDLLYDSDLLGDDLLAIAAMSVSTSYRLSAVTAYGRRIGALKRSLIAQRFLDMLGFEGVDVVPGADHPLQRPAVPGCRYCDDEIDAFMASPASPSRNPLLSQTQAAQYLVEKARKEPKKYSLLCTGPLTNAALAVSLDPEFPKNLSEVVIMGGTRERRGNSNPFAESNIFNDPEAAKIFFERFKGVTVIGLDVTLEVTIDHETTRRFEHSAAGKFIGALVDSCCRAHVKTEGQSVMPLHDVLAFYALEDPTLVTCERCAIDVETERTERLGALTFDLSDAAEKADKYAMAVDGPRVLARVFALADALNREEEAR